eukprot:3933364-Pyramimonas_sp.AAC.1
MYTQTNKYRPPQPRVPHLLATSGGCSRHRSPGRSGEPPQRSRRAQDDSQERPECERMVQDAPKQP